METWHERVGKVRANLKVQLDRLELWEGELAKISVSETTEDEQNSVITGLNEATHRIAEQIDALERLGAI